MVRQNVSVSEKDIREFVRILEGINKDVQDLKESRESDATAILFRGTKDNATASVANLNVSEIANPTMIWDDPDRGWDQSEWAE